jgi:adenylyltransferase/sulfurtransferase
LAKDVLKIDAVPSSGRFDRLELIGWWDQRRLANAKVLLIGVGALGNEILKNLALLGVGQVLAVDLDRVELSNLSRSVLFREEDCGRSKAEAAARRAAEIFPQMKVQPYVGNAVYDLGLGVYHWADVVLGGLDNREARVAMNRCAARAGKVWIDGAIERLSGVARVFDPAVGPCYECTMSDVDWKMLQARRSCALLNRDEMEMGKVPTTPTTASVVAGVQTQEAVKLLHGLETISGQGFVFDGQFHQSYLVSYTQKEDCQAHEPDDPVESTPWCIGETKAGDLLERVRSGVGARAVVETNQDLLRSLECTYCGETEDFFCSLGKATVEASRCPRCRRPRAPHFYHVIDDTDPALLDRTLGELGVPPWDVLAGREGVRIRYYAFDGDRESFLGLLAQGAQS